MKKLCTLWLALIPWFGYGQSASAPFGFQYNQQPTISVDGRALLNPWAGGLNAMLFATLRLNDDNRDDLLVYDRTSRKVSTFVAIDNPTGSGIAWQYAPAYEAMLPPLSGWVVAVDYDGDGRNDLFSLADSDVRVYHNDSQGGKVAFSVAVQTLMTVGFGGRQVLYASSVDMPAILDYDDDGDIDILAFDASGNLIAYQQNMSVERTGKKEGLDFKRPDCFYWGHFLKEFCNDFVFGINCDGTQSGKSTPLRPQPGVAQPGVAQTGAARPMHSGNTLAVLDTDGDGKKDLLFGAISCPGIARLVNVATNDSAARFTRFDTLFPAKNPVLFPAFAGVYSEDVDGDGIRDLLASPFVDQNENDLYDFRASGWYYKNVGTNVKPDFQLKQKDFLQADMLDLGENAVPALADLDGDGDMDLLVGYAGAQTGSGYRAGIWQFENKGTLQNPAFSLVTTDYLSLAQSLTLVNTMPTFADVDGNGSMDLIVTGTGANNLEIRLFVNAAAKGAPVQYNLPTAIRWPVPDLMQLGERLLVTDLDRDGKADVLLGKNNGLIHYFRNAGTTTVPVFQLQNQNFGNLPVTFYTGASSLVLADLNGDQKNEFITTSGDGKVKLYQFPDALTGPLTLLDSLPALGLPGLNLAATTADLDGDGLPDLLLGTGGGGLRYLKNTSQKVVVTGLPTETTGPWAFPNPTDRYLTIRAPHDGQVEMLSLSGQTVLVGQAVKGDNEQTLDLGSLAEGTYLLRLTTPGKAVLVEKVVIWK